MASLLVPALMSKVMNAAICVPLPAVRLGSLSITAPRPQAHITKTSNPRKSHVESKASFDRVAVHHIASQFSIFRGSNARKTVGSGLAAGPSHKCCKRFSSLICQFVACVDSVTFRHWRCTFRSDHSRRLKGHRSCTWQQVCSVGGCPLPLLGSSTLPCRLYERRECRQRGTLLHKRMLHQR